MLKSHNATGIHFLIYENMYIIIYSLTTRNVLNAKLLVI